MDSRPQQAAQATGRKAEWEAGAAGRSRTFAA